jgi:SAM-dependent methyltransferase
LALESRYVPNVRRWGVVSTKKLSVPDANLSVSRYDYALLSIHRVQADLPSSILYDIGAGDGRLRHGIESAGMRWLGFDLTPSGPAITRWDLTTKCPADAPRPGAALLLDVIEHLVNPGIALANIFDALAPDGRLVLTTPNPRWSRSRIHTLLTGYPGCFNPSDLYANHHVFPAWPHILMQMLHEVGFAIDEYVTLDGKTVWPSHPLSFRYPLRCLHATANILIECLDGSACGMSYGLIARALK